MITLTKLRKVLLRHVHFLGPGLVSSVAYIDPGNWATDLSAGALYGYKLLFIVLLSGLAAVVLQTLAVRLGATTSLSLPHQTRRIFLRLEKKYPKYRRLLRLGLYTLYGLAEIAIIATDLAELLGSAIALNLLFPRLPLYAGVLITAADVLIVLAFFRSDSGRQGMLFFEIVIVALVLAVFVSFMILLHLVRPDWGDVFFGIVPSKALVDPGALYVGVGIIGATVMPHALFLGSSLASVDRLNMLPCPPSEETPKPSYKMPSMGIWSSLRRRKGRSTPNSSSVEMNNTSNNGPSPTPSILELSTSSSVLSRMENSMEIKPSHAEDGQVEYKSAFEVAQAKYEMEIRKFDRIRWVDLHLLHATIDTIMSLLGFALTINASILTLAGAAFYYNSDPTGEPDIPGAYSLIKKMIGSGAATIFALALLCAGQSASITATLAGQVVSEGFINWRTSPFLRRLVTRLIGVIPAAVVAAAVGPKGLNTMLVASQVLLSIVLPTVIFPLVYLCSQESLMTVEGPEVDLRQVEGGGGGGGGGRRRKKNYTSPKAITIVGYALFAVVLLANGYVIVQLGLGNT